MSMFHIGQKVVCIGNPTVFLPGPWNLVVVGCVYTIRAIDRCGIGGRSIGFLLEEIVNPVYSDARYCGEPHFKTEIFRPVKTTSIEIFQKLLAPTPELVS